MSDEMVVRPLARGQSPLASVRGDTRGDRLRSDVGRSIGPGGSRIRAPEPRSDVVSDSCDVGFCRRLSPHDEATRVIHCPMNGAHLAPVNYNASSVGVRFEQYRRLRKWVDALLRLAQRERGMHAN